MNKIDLIIDALECASPTIKGVMYPAGYHMKLAQALAAARELKKKQECETCAAKRKRLMDAGFLKSPLRGEDHVD
jgi:hypothetical protein